VVLADCRVRHVESIGHLATRKASVFVEVRRHLQLDESTQRRAADVIRLVQ